MNFYSLIKPALFQLDAEKAHKLTIWALRNGLLPKRNMISHPALQTQVAGLDFNNPVGMAAGFDKNAETVKALSQQGLGFVEAGTVTPRPQDGNPTPRLFRLREDAAVINRMGFNNGGASVFEQNLARQRPTISPERGTIIGVNIGKNKTTEDAASDYLALLEKFYMQCDYITANISSPNTPGLRALQKQEALNELLETLANKRDALSKKHGQNRPLFLKIAPDISEQECEHIAQAATTHKLDALIISNTTIAERENLKSNHAGEAGGLSGKPLFSLSTETLRRIYRLTKGSIPLIGVGGIASADDAYTKIKAGASLLQVYSAFIYQGFSLVEDINKGLVERLERDGFKHLSDAVGADTASS